MRHEEAKPDKLGPFTSNILDTLTSSLLRRKAELGVELLVVGVEGKGCSGKSTLASELCSRAQVSGTAAQTVSLDDFCNPRALRYCSDVEEGLQVYQQNFDEELWTRDVLEPACRDGRLEIDQVLHDPLTDVRDHRVAVHLPHGGLLIAKGIHILKRRFQPYYHYKIFLHISDTEQLRRAHSRDAKARNMTATGIERKYRKRMVPSYAHFLATDHPLESADMILNNEDPSNPREMDVEKVRRRLDV